MSLVRGLGHDEQSLAPVAIARFARAEYSCRNAVAHPDQCRDEGVELSASIPRDVLSKDSIRPALSNDAEHLVDEKAIVVGAASLSCDAVWLARIA